MVASASYECRSFGVQSAMPTAAALRLCPQAILVSGHHERYAQLSHAVMALLGPLRAGDGADLDRRGFLDVTGTEALFGPPVKLAHTLQDRIGTELRLSASLGVAPNKLVAKIASDFGKPHGITAVPPGQEATFLAPLPIRRLWGVGRVTAADLGRLGIVTIGDLAGWPLPELRGRFGSHGEGLWRAARRTR